MSRTLIYLIGIFALWFYISIAKTKEQKAREGNGFGDIKSYDNAQSGHGGTVVSWGGNGGGFSSRYSRGTF